MSEQDGPTLAEYVMGTLPTIYDQVEQDCYRSDAPSALVAGGEFHGSGWIRGEKEQDLATQGIFLSYVPGETVVDPTAWVNLGDALPPSSYQFWQDTYGEFLPEVPEVQDAPHEFDRIVLDDDE